jgi:hypothetical protein
VVGAGMEEVEGGLAAHEQMLCWICMQINTNNKQTQTR